MKKTLFSFLILLFLVGVLFPFGLWKALDDVRFDTVDSLSRLRFYIFSPYSPKSLADKLTQPAPLWMEKRIQEDIGSLTRQQHSKEALDLYLQRLSPKDLEDHLLIRFTVKQGAILQYPESLPRFQGRLAAVRHALESLHSQGFLPDGLDFILCINDKIFDGYGGEVPIFVFSKDIQDVRQKNLILIPDGMNLSRWAYIYPTIRFASFVFPWSKKKDLVLWRGSNTNPIREYAVKQTSTLPFLDAAMTEGRDASYMIPEYQLQAKYLLSLDGISSTWPGLLWKLASNAVVFKQDSSHTQWYYGGVLPGVHYVPVKNDLSDLEAAYAWAKTHPEESQKISQNAQRFVEENLLYEDMLHYMARVFRAYAKNV